MKTKRCRPLGEGDKDALELRREEAEARAGAKQLQVVACELNMPTLDMKGKCIGAHGLPVHLLSTDGKTNTGNGVAWVFAGKQAADELARRYNTHAALVEALRELDDAVNEPSLGIDIVKASDKARSALALVEGGGK